jgi:hypothetical protein
MIDFLLFLSRNTERFSMFANGGFEMSSALATGDMDQSTLIHANRIEDGRVLTRRSIELRN